MMDSVRTLTADYPENVFYCKRLTRDEIRSLMEQCTFVWSCSRNDPMPTFVTEGPIFGKPSMCQNNRHRRLISEGRNIFFIIRRPAAAIVLRSTPLNTWKELAGSECRVILLKAVS